MQDYSLLLGVHYRARGGAGEGGAGRGYDFSGAWQQRQQGGLCAHLRARVVVTSMFGRATCRIPGYFANFPAGCCGGPPTASLVPKHALLKPRHSVHPPVPHAMCD